MVGDQKEIMALNRQPSPCRALRGSPGNSSLHTYLLFKETAGLEITQL